MQAFRLKTNDNAHAVEYGKKQDAHGSLSKHLVELSPLTDGVQAINKKEIDG